jgi:hypothetical protein
LNVPGAVISKKTIQLLDSFWDVAVADTINHVQPFTGVRVEETQMVWLSVRERIFRAWDQSPARARLGRVLSSGAC